MVDDKTKKKLTDEEVFEIFGVGTETANIPLRKFISGQRKINGRLYEAIELILEALPKDSTSSAIDFKKLALAGQYNDGVPGDPPGCVSPPKVPSGGLP